MDEAAVRAVLSRLVDGGESSQVAEDVCQSVVIEGGWGAVVLNPARATPALMADAHELLSAAFPEATIEIRLGDRVYRGGAGFGSGRHVVAVLGGKGGVGKSTIAVSLALTLSAMGSSVGVLDGDLNAPDIPHILGVHPRERSSGHRWQLWRTEPAPPSQWRRPYARFGLEVMSTGFVLSEEEAPVVTTRAMVSALLRHLIFEVAWSAEVLIIDAPPGTGEELQVMAQDLPLSGAILVTTPQDLAQMDAGRTLSLLAAHGVPVLGVVQNMAALRCPHCAQEIDMFARSSRLVDAGVPILGRVPFDVGLSEGIDRGLPLVLGDPRGPIAAEFARIGHAVRRWLIRRDGAVAA